MATESQINANRRNAQKSTGPKTAEGKAVVAQNALKHGLFAHENVIKCEKQSDFERFRDELLIGLAPAGGVEAMLAERVVSLSWRLKRAERMSSEVIDVKIAQATAGSWDQSRRRDAGLAEDSGDGQPELILGWATMRDFSESQVLERLLMYEKRIESSLYKAMNELQKLQRLREREQVCFSVDVKSDCKKQTQSLFSAASANSAVNEKQSQFSLSLMGAMPFTRKDYDNNTCAGGQENKAGQIQTTTPAPPVEMGNREKMISGASCG